MACSLQPSQAIPVSSVALASLSLLMDQLAEVAVAGLVQDHQDVALVHQAVVERMDLVLLGLAGSLDRLEDTSLVEAHHTVQEDSRSLGHQEDHQGQVGNHLCHRALEEDMEGSLVRKVEAVQREVEVVAKECRLDVEDV